MTSLLIGFVVLLVLAAGMLALAQYRATGGEPAWSVDAYDEDHDWAPVHRTVIAPSIDVVESLFRQQGMRIRSIRQTPIWRRMLRRDIRLSDFRTKVPARQISDMAQTMASFTEASVPMQEAINAYGRQSPDNMCRGIMRRIHADLQGGRLKITEAFSARAEQLGPEVVAILIAGMTAEEGLEGAFQQIAEMSEKRASIAQQWRKAMIYPCIVLTITIAALGFMLWKVVPEFQSVYSQFKSPLPFLTKVTIDVSKGLFSHSYVLVLLIVVFVALIWWARSNTTSRLQWDRIECKLPLLGKVFEGSALGRAMATLSGLLAVGVPTQEALKFAVPACGNKWIEKVLGDVADALGTKDIQEAVRDNAKNLPDTLVGFIETGAATADLDTVLKRYARFAQRDADVAVQSLSTFIEPIMLIIVGGIVGVIVISMYLPMINLVKVIH